MTERGSSILVGAAVGESMAAPSLVQRAALMPDWTRRLGRELDEFGDHRRVTDHVSPFGLNVVPTPLTWGPGDATDWMAWRAEGHVRGLASAEVWSKLAADRDGVRGRISAMTALDAIAGGEAPCGSRNPHGHDDAAAIRALGLAGAGASRAEVLDDARITASGEGLRAAALVRDVAHAMVAGATSVEAVAALDEMAWPGRLGARWHEVQALVGHITSPWQFAVELALTADAVYSYGSMASETVPVAIGMVLVGADHDPVEVIGASLQLHRQSATLPVLVGGLLGASRAVGQWPSWLVELARHPSGCSIPGAQTLDLVTLEGAGHG